MTYNYNFAKLNELMDEYMEIRDRDFDYLYLEIDADSDCLLRDCPETEAGDTMADKIEELKYQYLERLENAIIEISTLSVEELFNELEEINDSMDNEFYEIKRDWRYDYQNLLEEVDQLKA